MTQVREETFGAKKTSDISLLLKGVGSAFNVVSTQDVSADSWLYFWLLCWLRSCHGLVGRCNVSISEFWMFFSV